MLHNVCTCLSTRVAWSQAQRGLLRQLFLGLFLLLTLLEQSYGQVFGRMADQLELGQNELDLLD